MDLAFVIDASSSVGIRNFRRVKKFLKKIASSFIIGPRNVRIGAVVFSSRPQLAFGFNAALNKRDVKKAINRRIRFVISSTQTILFLFKGNFFHDLFC